MDWQASLCSCKEKDSVTKHVLIIEDHYDIQEMLQARLEIEGYSVSLARDGQEALEQIEIAIPAIILLDLSLPRMDGSAFLKALEDQRPELSLPIIIITANPQAAAKLAKKPAAILPKPFSLQSLITAIKEALTLSEAGLINYY
jgi:CheY-like chemotaxis protein